MISSEAEFRGIKDLMIEGGMANDILAALPWRFVESRC